jgi:hypothetical protein
LFTEILQKLNEIDKKIEKYHKEEMEELNAIGQQIATLHDVVEYKLIRLDRKIDDQTRFLQFDQLGELSQCNVVYKSVTADRSVASQPDTFPGSVAQSTFTPHPPDNSPLLTWLTNENALIHTECFRKSTSFFNNIAGFAPIYVVGEADEAAVSHWDSGQGTPALNDTLEFIRDTVKPMQAVSRTYNLNILSRRYSMPRSGYLAISEELRQANKISSSLPQNANLVINGGDRLVNNSLVIFISKIMRENASLRQLMAVCDKGEERPLRYGDLRNGLGDSCATGDLARAEDLLDKQEIMLRSSLAQEALIAGLPLLSWGAEVLENDIAAGWLVTQHKQRSPEADAFRTSLTRVFLDPPPGESKAITPRSSCGNEANAPSSKARSMLCLMQSNMYYATNLLRYVIWKKLRAQGKNAQYYAGLLASPTAEKRLSDLLDGLPIRAARANESGTAATYIVQLPRVMSEAKQGMGFSDISALESEDGCWRSQGSGQEWWDDVLVLPKDRFGDLRLSFCVILPSELELEKEVFQFRPGYARIAQELFDLQKTKAELELDPVKPVVPSTDLAIAN